MIRRHTLTEHIMQEQRKYPGASGGFTGLLSDIATASKIIAREVRQAGLGNILGAAGSTNVSGDEVKKLDLIAHEIFVNVLERTGHLCIMASEEDEDPITIPDRFPAGKYVFVFDPLDGSSNIDANVSVGTIFSIFRKISTDERGGMVDILQPASEQICAGYIVYGSSTLFVYTVGHGVHGFTLDPTIGEYILSHEDIRMPDQGQVFSINEGNRSRWFDYTSDYVDWIKSSVPDEGRPYTARYIGSLVADFHRNLLYGGIFLYPEDRENPNGKLRLLYEAAPIAFLAEQAGGLATTGETSIRSIEPAELHQKVSLIVGSRNDVLAYERFRRGDRP